MCEHFGWEGCGACVSSLDEKGGCLCGRFGWEGCSTCVSSLDEKCGCLCEQWVERV